MKLPIPEQCPTDAGAAFAALCAKDRLEGSDLIMLALLEASGRSLYSDLAELSDNAEVSDLLNKNGQEELGHAHRILKALTVLTGNQYELPEDASNPLVGPSGIKALTPELMQSFIQAEIDGEAHYERWAANESDDEVAKIYRQNGADERRHSERDRQILAILQS